MRDEDFLRFLAAWQLVHETVDEGLEAAIRRGREAGAADIGSGDGAFVDGLAAMVDERKEAMKRSLAEGAREADVEDDVGALLEEIRFELGAIRGRLEALETAVDALGGVEDGASPDRED